MAPPYVIQSFPPFWVCANSCVTIVRGPVCADRLAGKSSARKIAPRHSRFTKAVTSDTPFPTCVRPDYPRHRAYDALFFGSARVSNGFASLGVTGGCKGGD